MLVLEKLGILVMSLGGGFLISQDMAQDLRDLFL